MTALEFHDLANIFPLIEGAEFEELKNDIAANGLHEPVILCDGKILDGRNRYRAAAEVGVEPKYIHYQGSDPLGYVVSLNLRRRHLSDDQRRMVAATLVTVGQGRPGKTSQFANINRYQASQMLNTDVAGVDRARKVVKDGVNELVNTVLKGNISVSAATDIAGLESEEQQEIVARGPREILKTANRIRREKKEQSKAARQTEVRRKAATVSLDETAVRILLHDCADLLNVPYQAYDWIITDPPYSKEYLHTFETLAAIAAKHLVPGGSLLCMSGQLYLPDVFELLSAELDYHWTLAYLTPGGQAAQIFPRRVNTFWKPVLWFTKGERTVDTWSGDVSKSQANDNDKSHHHWGQSVSGMHDLMVRFVKPGDVVLDPFMGAGTTGEVALKLQAKFIGYEIDEDHFNQSKVRLAACLKDAQTACDLSVLAGWDNRRNQAHDPEERVSANDEERYIEI